MDEKHTYKDGNAPSVAEPLLMSGISAEVPDHAANLFDNDRTASPGCHRADQGLNSVRTHNCIGYSSVVCYVHQHSTGHLNNRSFVSVSFYDINHRRNDNR